VLRGPAGAAALPHGRSSACTGVEEDDDERATDPHAGPGRLRAGAGCRRARGERGPQDDPHTKNLHPLGHIQEPRSLINPRVGNTKIHTDIAFWAKLAFQGNWDGFTIRDIAAPGNPTTISPTSCDGTQGDIVVWESILVRSWTRPPAHPGRSGRA
jgi:hypothetical protein